MSNKKNMPDVINTEPKLIDCHITLSYHHSRITKSDKNSLIVKIIGVRDGKVSFSMDSAIDEIGVNTSGVKNRINCSVEKKHKDIFLKELIIGDVYLDDYIYTSYRGSSSLEKIKDILIINLKDPENVICNMKTSNTNIKKIDYYGGFFLSDMTMSNVERKLPYKWQKANLSFWGSWVAFGKKDTSINNIEIPMSLGYLGRLLIEFLTPVNSVEIRQYVPGEKFEVRFGDSKVLTKSETKNDYYWKKKVNLIRLISDGKFIVEDKVFDLETAYKKTKFLTLKSYKYVEIFDASYGGTKQKDYYPGLDIESIIINKSIKNLYIVLDISGSMSDNENGEFDRSGKLEPATASDGSNGFSSRLYTIVAEAIKDNLLSDGQTSTVNINLITFYGEGDTITKEGDNIVIKKTSNTIKSLPASNKENFIKNINSEITLLKNNGYHDKSPVKSAICRALYDINKDSNVKDDDPSLVIVITDGAGENVGESLSDLNDIKPWGKTGVIEYIGYHLYHLKSDVADVKQRKILQKKEPVEKLYDFSKQNQEGNWMVHPHIVNEKIELNELLKNLSKKYNL